MASGKWDYQRGQERKVQVVPGNFYGECRLRSPSHLWKNNISQICHFSARKTETFFLLLPSKLPQTQRKITFSYLMEMTYSRHCLTPFSGFVISLKCSINFGKRLKRNQRPALSFSLKGPNLVFHLSSTFPKPDLPQNWLCVS